MKFILSIDQGTTGTTSCLINSQTFEFVGKVNKEYPQIYPQPSWVEHNLIDIWNTVEYTVKSVLEKFNISPEHIIAIGITNQRETTCAYDRRGIPLANAIVWQDRRTNSFCEDLKSRDLSEKILKKTGLKIDPYFSGSKMNWLLKNNENVKRAQKENNLLLGNIDSFLLYKLSAGKSFKTDASNASRTMLMDLKTSNWDPELLEIFDINLSELPTISDSFGEFGVTKNLSFLPDGIPITGILGDQQSALIGQAGFNKGDMKCTYGTGAFVLLNTGEEIIYSKHGLLTTTLFKYKEKTFYALEGSSYIAGAAVQWLRDNLKIISNSPEVETLARKVTNLSELEHVLFFPYFTGIGSPHWSSDARAAILGLTRDTNNSHLAFAALEGIALSIDDLLEAFRADTHLPILDLKVDGGACMNNLLMDLQATYSKTKIIRPKVIETTAYGAAIAAAIGANLCELSQLQSLWKVDCEFKSQTYLHDYCKSKKSNWSTSFKKIYI